MIENKIKLLSIMHFAESIKYFSLIKFYHKYNKLQEKRTENISIFRSLTFI